MDATPPEETASRLDRLVILRAAQEALLAGGVPARELAALSKEYRATLAEIAELDPVKPEVDLVDEIAQRRDSRRAGPAKGPTRSKRSG